MVFLTVPYGPGPEIGGLDGVFRPEMPVWGQKCHPEGDMGQISGRFSVRAKSPYIQGTRKVEFKMAKMAFHLGTEEGF